MRQVFDNSTVAHKWANQHQETGRTPNGNLFFDGDKIYSYGRHFLIAKHHTHNGIYAVLFTTRKYSVSTSQHVNYVRQALPTDYIIFCSKPDGISHKENFEQWTFEIENEAKNLLKAKKPEKYLNTMAGIYGQAEKYAAYFGLDIPEKLKIAYSITSKDDYLNFEQQKEALRIKEEKEAAKKLKARHKKELKDWLGFKTNRLSIRDGFDY